MKAEIAERLNRHIMYDTNGGCWLWSGALGKEGYGRINNGRSTSLTHRVSWESHFGPIPKGLYVCHKCDVRACVNPNHLFLGTSSDNMQDASRKGRTTWGEKSASAKLSEIDVAAIRADPNEQRYIARSYGVSQSLISMIKSGQRWARQMQSHSQLGDKP